MYRVKRRFYLCQTSSFKLLNIEYIQIKFHNLSKNKHSIFKLIRLYKFYIKVFSSQKKESDERKIEQNITKAPRIILIL